MTSILLVIAIITNPLQYMDQFLEYKSGCPQKATTTF